jgi:hypothetical protein
MITTSRLGLHWFLFRWLYDRRAVDGECPAIGLAMIFLRDVGFAWLGAAIAVWAPISPSLRLARGR